MMEAFVLDRTSILVRLGDDEEIYDMMVDMFMNDLENNCVALSKALANADSGTVLREVHTIKGLLATFSDEAGAAFAMTLERQAKAGNIAGMAGDIEALQERLREVAGVLRSAGQA